MASEINVDKITPQTGTTLELGDNGDTITVTGTLDGSGLTGLNATNLTSGTVPDARFPATLPAASGANLTSLPSANLTGALPAIDGSALTGIETGTAWQSTIVTGTTLTALAGRGYWIDTTSNQCTITFPSSASVGDTIELVDYARTWGTNKIIIDSNGLNYQGEADTATVEYDTSGQALRVVYSGATKGWIPTSDEVSEDNPLTPYSVDFLVIAGGGGAGNDGGGGGGAGGYRASYNSEASGGGGSSESAITVTPNTQYTVTVGAGGVANDSTNGSDSVFSTITSIGGGRGAKSPTSANNGGSGGGGHRDRNTGGSGTANQGFNGGNGVFIASAYGDGGGGGAGSAGSNGTGSAGGAGGNGVASTITGSSVTRAGGGGGGTYSGSSVGAGGSGGGGSNGSAGTANTGSGGGGSANNGSSSGAGGSGIVILRMPTASYSGTTTGSPTVTTSGSDTILTYTGSGSYTA